MAGLADMEVPSYLQPPSQAQGEQLAMEHNQQEMQQAQILQKGFERMQKKVAMAKVMGDAAELQAAGKDPQEARSLAILKSGRGLFDTPEEWNKVSTELENSISQKKAVKAFHDEIDQELSQPDENGNYPDPNEVLPRLWAKHGMNFLKGNFNPVVSQMVRSKTQDKTLQEKAREADQTSKRIEARDAWRKMQGEEKIGLENQKLDLGYAQEAGRNERYQTPSANVQAQQEGANKRASDKASQPTASQKERADYAKLVRDEKDLQLLVKSNPGRGDLKSMLEDVQTQKQAWEVKYNAREETIESTPGGGFKLTRGGSGTGIPGLTTPEATKEGEKKDAGQDTLRTLGRLQDDLQQGVVGLGSNVSNVIFDKVLPALGVESASQERILGRQDIRLANQTLMGALSKRFSTTELSRIKEMLPSLGFIENVKDAKLLVSGIQRQIAEENAAAARKLKQEPDEQTIQTLANLQGVSWESLAEDVKKGRLDRATFEKVVAYANATKGQNARPANKP